MAENEHQVEAAQRMLNLVYLIRVTKKLGEETLPEDFVDGYNQALDDMLDAIQCEFGIFEFNYDWLWEE